MTMSMMRIRIMRVRMCLRLVLMAICVASIKQQGFAVIMLMMFIMDVFVFVLQGFMGMFVFMTLTQAQHPTQPLFLCYIQCPCQLHLCVNTCCLFCNARQTFLGCNQRYQGFVSVP